MKNVEEVGIKFWRDIHAKADWKNTEDFNMETELRKQTGTTYYDLHEDRYDMEAVFNICRQFAKRLAGTDCCYTCKVDPIFDGAIKWEYIAFGWGDPQCTRNYGYIYFDFSLDGEGRAYVSRNDQEDRLLTIEQMFKELYV